MTATMLDADTVMSAPPSQPHSTSQYLRHGNKRQKLCTTTTEHTPQSVFIQQASSLVLSDTYLVGMIVQYLPAKQIVANSRTSKAWLLAVSTTKIQHQISDDLWLEPFAPPASVAPIYHDPPNASVRTAEYTPQCHQHSAAAVSATETVRSLIIVNPAFFEGPCANRARPTYQMNLTPRLLFEPHFASPALLDQFISQPPILQLHVRALLHIVHYTSVAPRIESLVIKIKDDDGVRIGAVVEGIRDAMQEFWVSSSSPFMAGAGYVYLPKCLWLTRPPNGSKPISGEGERLEKAPVLLHMLPEELDRAWWKVLASMGPYRPLRLDQKNAKIKKA